tara:strand:+ start:319 stop:531 length:213 start_codon:yes stop_codon:yes gene_type:complete
MIKMKKLLPLICSIIFICSQFSLACHDCKTHEESKKARKEIKEKNEKSEMVDKEQKTLLKLDLRRIIRNL